MLEAEGFDPARVSDFLAEPGTVVWLDVCRPEPGDLEVVAEELGLHPLAREDATGRPQRPKLEPYAGHQFLVAYAARFDAATGELATSGWTSSSTSAGCSHDLFDVVRQVDEVVDEVEEALFAGGGRPTRFPGSLAVYFRRKDWL